MHNQWFIEITGIAQGQRLEVKYAAIYCHVFYNFFNEIFLFLIGIAVIIAVQIVCTAVLVNTIRNKGQRMSGASDSMVQDLSCNQKGESA